MRPTALALLATVGACSAAQPGGELVPASGRGTAYPCGLQGVSCSPGWCCDGLDSLCGSNEPASRCPAGECCYDPGESGYGASRELRVRGPQREEQ